MSDESPTCSPMEPQSTKLPLRPISEPELRKLRDSMSTADWVAAQRRAIGNGVTGCFAEVNGEVLVPDNSWPK